MSVATRRALASLPDYTDGDLRDLNIRIRMHRNECPIPPPAHVLDAVRNVSGDVLRTYPAELAIEVRERLAERIGVDPAMLLLTSGADEALAAVGIAFADERARVVTASPTFGMYARVAAVAGAQLQRIAYSSRWVADYDAMIAAKPRVLILCHPNNPTGELLARADAKRIAAALPDTLVVIDEVYLALSGPSLVRLAQEYDNVVVIGSFSKTAALAGTRVGYAVAQANVLSALRRVLPPYPLSSLSLVAACAYLAQRDATARFETQLRATIDTSLTTIIDSLAPMTQAIWRGPANFALIDAGPQRDAIVAALRRDGIAVRAFDDPDLRTCLRVCAASDADTAEFIAAYRSAYTNNENTYAIA